MAVSVVSGYSAFFVDGGPGSNALNVYVSGGAVAGTIPSGPNSGRVHVAYQDTAVSDIVFANFGSVNP